MFKIRICDQLAGTIEISDELLSKRHRRIVEFIATGRPMPFASSRSSLDSSKSRVQGVLCRIPLSDRFLPVLNVFSREESTSLKL